MFRSLSRQSRSTCTTPPALVTARLLQVGRPPVRAVHRTHAALDRKRAKGRARKSAKRRRGRVIGTTRTVRRTTAVSAVSVDRTRCRGRSDRRTELEGKQLSNIIKYFFFYRKTFNLAIYKLMYFYFLLLDSWRTS